MIATVWSGLLVPGVFAAVDDYAPTGAAADAALAAHAGPRIELSEVLAASAAVHGLNLPRTDERTAAALRRYGSPAEELGSGIVGILPDGRLALGLGGGRTVESLGESLGIVADPGAGRYAELWEIPGALYLQRMP